MKICTKCDIKKSLTEFGKKKEGKNGLASACKECVSIQRKQHYQDNKEIINARTSKYYRENKEKHNEASSRYYRKHKEKISGKSRGRWLKDKYDLTEQQYEEMLKNQGGKCKICNSENINAKSKGNLVIDHCHKSGKVRGLLCDKCNMGLGTFNDDIQLFKNAIEYLEKSK